MKHVYRVSVEKPAHADIWQEAVCRSIEMLGAFSTSKGGTSQLQGFAGSKCYWPEDEETGTGTE